MKEHNTIEWEFGDEGLDLLSPEIEPPPPVTRKADNPAPRYPWFLVFLIALAASWTTGFYLGRAQYATAALEADLQGRLDIEAWAWKQGDWELFRSLLPRRTPSWHIIELRDRFRATTPRPLKLKLKDYTLSEDGTQIEAIVQISEAGRRYDVERTYWLIDGRWRLVKLGEYSPQLLIAR